MVRPAEPTPCGREIEEQTRVPGEVSTAAVEDKAASADAQLARCVAEMAAGNQRALEQLYELTVRRVYTVAVRVMRRAEAAEEVVEDTYWQAWRDASRYDPSRGRVLTWLLTICRSRALDALRRRDIAEASDDVDALRDEEASERSEPSAMIEAMERDSAVRAALASLKPQARQLVSLAFFRGMTQQEIAQASGLPLGTVKATLFRAYQQMRMCLTGHGLGPEHE
jgi:RNA polymerase sigma-70 factor (ECF subfamily)